MPLHMRDLDFDSSDSKSLHDREVQDALREIRNTRAVLGEMTLRDSTEAVYGTQYANQVFGEDGGNDILVGELNVIDDMREANGYDRYDVGDNRLPGKTFDSEERQKAVANLAIQEDVAEKAVDKSVRNWYHEDAKAFQRGTKSYQDAIRERYPEDAETIIRLVEESQRDE